MEVREVLGVSKEGRGMASSHSFSPRVPPTTTPPQSRHPHCRLDAGKHFAMFQLD